MIPRAKGEWTLEEAGHLLNRAGFGGPPEEIRRLYAMGRTKAVDWLLEGVDLSEEWEDSSAEKSEELREQLRELRRKRKELGEEEADRQQRELRRMRQREQREGGRSLTAWWFDRMVHTETPLREKMVLFWHDHFASSIRKVKSPKLMHNQNELFRKHAYGNFKMLTHAVVKDPAMVVYLDVANSKKDKPNENFAREVLELFTLGEGNYSETDIKEAARAFTGYQFHRLTRTVTHRKALWDQGRKTVLGETGAFDGDGIIEVIFKQKAASHLLPKKLWEYFVYERPSEKAVAALAEIFASENFEVKPLLREIFLSREFYSERAIRSQIKSPIQFLVQLCRQLEIDRLPPLYVAGAQLQLGQTLFQPPNVAGWDWGQAWINTNTLLARYNIAGFITRGAREENLKSSSRGGGSGMAMMQRGMKLLQRNWKGPDYEKLVPREVREDSARLVDALAFRLFQAPLGNGERTKFIKYADAQRGVIFTNTEIAELVHVMMSTPYYQLT